MIDDGPTHILKLLDVELRDAGLYKAVVESFMSTTELVSQVTVRSKQHVDGSRLLTIAFPSETHRCGRRIIGSHGYSCE